MVGLCFGAYGLLDGSAVGPSGVPALVVGTGLCVVGLVVGGRRVRRSQYRPDPWEPAEWAVVVCGLVPAVVMVGGLGTSAIGLHPSVDPLSWPTLPVGPALAVLFGGLAGVVAPPPVRPARTVPDAGPEVIAADRNGPPATGRRRRRPVRVTVRG
jgi:energy-coupling factor transport system permease protein